MQWESSVDQSCQEYRSKCLLCIEDSCEQLDPNHLKIEDKLNLLNEFRRNSKQVDRKNFLYIEYLLHRGKHQLDQLRSPATIGLSSLNLKSSDATN